MILGLKKTRLNKRNLIIAIVDDAREHRRRSFASDVPSGLESQMNNRTLTVVVLEWGHDRQLDETRRR